MPLLETKGAASAQGFGLTLGSSYTPTYIEDVFSTTLYQGTNSYRAVDVGVSDLATKGALFWAKARSQSEDHKLYDTARSSSGAGGTRLCSPALSTNSASIINSGTSIEFQPTGTSLIFNGSGEPNLSSVNYAGWTFREQPKFFDVVTWSGNSTPRTIAHNLGSAPGCIIVKAYSGPDASTANWAVYHQSLGNGFWLRLESTGAALATGNLLWTTTAPTSTEFSVGSIAEVNRTGNTYVAYLFANDAGGFGLTGTDNVISCGSYSPSAGAPSTFVNLGWEPQWVLIKNTNISGSSFTGWGMFDNMRGVTTPTDDQFLLANSSNAESNGVPLSIPSYVDFNATGFTANATTLTGANGGGHTYIYIAIRRGPMKTPTSGTSVFYPQTVAQTDTPDSTGVPFPPDLVNTFSRNGTDRSSAYDNFLFVDRLRGLGTPNNTFSASGPGLVASSTNAEISAGPGGAYVQLKADGQNITRGGGWNSTLYGNWIYYFMRRAPGFFDVVCYTGTGSNLTLNHNLGVAPELMIIKARSASSPWAVYAASEGINKTADLNRGDLGFYTETGRWLATPTATQFSVKPGATLNSAGQTQVAYLFASTAGVSKVGSYTGTGALQTINCGFTGGARWVMIKRADSAGDWFTYDSARGITSGNDPYLLMNSTAAEVTGTNYVDTTSVGFQVTAAAPAGLNANGGTYIFLAIA